MGDSRKGIKSDSAKSSKKKQLSSSNSSKRKKDSKKKKSKRKKRESDKEKDKKERPSDLDEDRRTVDDDQKSKTTPDRTTADFCRDNPMSQDQRQVFYDFARDTLQKGISGILTEYRVDLTRYTPPNITRKAFDQNPDKNRYTDVLCIDQTRVLLKPNNDYIHANLVRGDPLLNCFICCQGPMMHTIKDFWQLVYQERVANIIMLCDTVEQGKEKCQQYWPREEGCVVEFPGYHIKNVKIDNSDSTTIINTLELRVNKGEKQIVKHYHWRTWPDKSVPSSVLAPFRVMKAVRHSPTPTVVHCSAGIGRTGSVVALEICFQQLLMENQLSVLDMVKWLRGQRMHAVQTDLQYLYLYKCLIAFASKSRLIPKEVTLEHARFEEDYQRIIDEKLKGDATQNKYAPLVFPPL